MTTLEYMERQFIKYRNIYCKELERKVPEEQLKNIERKIKHYEEAIEAIKKMIGEAQNGN